MRGVQGDNSIALRNFRILSGEGFERFVYTQVGYDPNNNVPIEWKQFHDRVSLVYNKVPHGFFSVFKESADLIVTLGQSGLHIDNTFVPDINVGISWAKHWQANDFDDVSGERRKFEHNYPDYFLQAASNPQEPWSIQKSRLANFVDGSERYTLERVNFINI